MQQSYTPEPTMIIDNLETLKVLTDERRLEILKVLELKNRALSVKEIAEALHVEDPRNLYYHINLLERHQILVVAQTQIIGNIIEKKYHLRAYSFAIHHDMFSPEETEELVAITQTAFIDRAKLDFIDSYRKELLQHDPENYFLGRSVSAIPADKVEEFRRKIDELLHSLTSTQNTDTDLENPIWYSLTAVFVPLDSDRSDIDFSSENESDTGEDHNV